MSSNYGSGYGKRFAALDDQAERAVTALEQCQRMRDQMREERDAAIAAHAALKAAAQNLIDHWPEQLPFAITERLAGPAGELRAAIAKA